MAPNVVPIAGAIIDPAFHVNQAWHSRAGLEPYQASLITPATSHRVLGLAVLAPAAAPVPEYILAWKEKAALKETGLLEGTEAAVLPAGGRVRAPVGQRAQRQ